MLGSKSPFLWSMFIAFAGCMVAATIASSIEQSVNAL